MPITDRSLSRRSLLGGAGAVAATAALPAIPAHAKDRELLIFLALDGFDIDYLDGRVPLPNIRSLIRNGSLATSTGVMTSITNPSWTSISCGTYPDKTHNAAYYFVPETGTGQGQSRDSAVEGIGQAWRRQGVLMASAQWFILQDKGVAFGDPEGLYTQPGGRFDARIDDAIAILKGEAVDSNGTMITMPRRPDFVAVYSSDVDGDGHSWGPNDPGMLDTLRETDRQIGRLIRAVRDLDLYGQTTWVLTADHGMTEWNTPIAVQAIEALTGAGFTPEVFGSSGSPSSPDTDIVLISGGSISSVHLLGDRAADPDAIDTARRTLVGVEGVSAVLTKRDQAELRMAPQYGELVVELAEPYAMTPNAPAEASDGRHGSRDEMQIPLIVSGRHARRGARARKPRHIDLAATMSAILGVDPPAASEGRVLSELHR